MIRKMVFAFAFILFSADLIAQSDSLMLQKALRLKDERHFNESLVLFRELLRRDSSNVSYLSNTSYLMARQGIHMATSQQRLQAYGKARYLAEKAIRINSANAEAHLSLALALGRESEEGSTSLKIANAKLIRTEAERAIALDPKMAAPYHVLGKWHQVVAGFNGFEKTMISTFFGPGLEGGTYEDAIQNFNKAISLEPENVNHYYQLGLTYQQRDKNGDSERAFELYRRIISINPPSTDDKIIVKEAAKRLQKP